MCKVGGDVFSTNKICPCYPKHEVTHTRPKPPTPSLNLNQHEQGRGRHFSSKQDLPMLIKARGKSDKDNTPKPPSPRHEQHEHGRGIHFFSKTKSAHAFQSMWPLTQGQSLNPLVQLKQPPTTYADRSSRLTVFPSKLNNPCPDSTQARGRHFFQKSNVCFSKLRISNTNRSPEIVATHKTARGERQQHKRDNRSHQTMRSTVSTPTRVLFITT